MLKDLDELVDLLPLPGHRGNDLMLRIGDSESVQIRPRGIHEVTFLAIMVR